MCGIAGYFHFDKNKVASSKILKNMTNTLRHRGPDYEDFFIKKNLAFGQRGLSIISLSDWSQPIYNEDESVIVIYDGEIYNYIELRDELRKLGCNFKTESDTEVIIRAYEYWGIDCQNKFNGMWAFAIWDENKKELILSRDRLGIKPLHYTVCDNTFIFGSEIKSILAYGFQTEANIELLEIYLTLGYIPAPYTFYKNIIKVKPGHYLIIRNSNIKEYKHWDLPEIDEGNMISDKKLVYEEFEFLLKDSVKLRMRGEVPFGAFLSGGLDSSCIVALMSSISNFPIETFTLGFDVKEYDERNFAREIAISFNTNHHESMILPDSFNDAINRITYYYDEPFGDSSAIPIGFISKYACNNVKMVLTGDGGDEALSGYTVYQGEKFANQYQNIPKIIREKLPFFLEFFFKHFCGNIKYKINRVLNVLETSNMNFNPRLIAKSSWINIALIKSLLNGRNGLIKIEEYIDNFMKNCLYQDNFYKRMYFNIKLSLPDDSLTKVDRMSMSYSLETRTPFLDYRLIELMVKVDKNIKMEGYKRKSILRNTIGKKLPNSILKAPKKGFVIPIREWFKKDDFEIYLRDLDLLTHINLNKDILDLIIKENTEGRQDFGNFIWILLILEKWLSKNKFI